MARLQSSIMPLLLCAAAAAWCLGALPAFTGSSAVRPQVLRGSQTSVAAMSEVDAITAMEDASTVLLADSNDAIPFVAFLVSIFIGIVGYSTWTAFGPGAGDLRDPFEEHED
mmetsp:Transcript_56385/g.145176  ORF Transcript_56385/g.145176 Transcript_56385/m.145176 type:complete len:112 (+) Transcript_56385:69-404(+)